MVIAELFACASASDSPKAMRYRTGKSNLPLQMRTNKVPTNDRFLPSRGIIDASVSIGGRCRLIARAQSKFRT